jgi:nitroimidazol reductase NimA-like FMN-containing flavoprotein (pyridoxamine 5'-phosphate oxidase superfamily)
MNKGSSRIRKDIRKLLSSQMLAVLATAGSEHPYCTLVGFAFTEDLRSLVFATTRDTRKFRNIEVDSKVSLLIDSRKNRVGDFKNAEAVTVLGTAAEITGRGRGSLRKLYLDRHPHLDDFLDSPDTALIKIAVRRYIIVQRFQEVRELDIT